MQLLEYQKKNIASKLQIINFSNIGVIAILFDKDFLVHSSLLGGEKTNHIGLIQATSKSERGISWTND